MAVYKQGSRGEDVKKIQRALGLTADGIFGPGTDKAVKEFQKKNGLVADGIVGDKTLGLLFKNLTSEKNATKGGAIDPCVIYKPLPVHVTKSVGRPIKYLAIHFTAGSNSKPGKAQSTYNTFVNREASADFTVDDRDIVQFNPDIKNYYCWAVGDAKKSSKGGGKYNGKAMNKNTISIEICSTCVPATQTAVSKANHSGWTFTPSVLNNAVKIAKIIMKKYNIPIENVIRHYDITGKWCPGIPGWNEEQLYNVDGKAISGKFSDNSEWIKFKKQLA